MDWGIFQKRISNADSISIYEYFFTSQITFCIENPGVILRSDGFDIFGENGELSLDYPDTIEENEDCDIVLMYGEIMMVININ